jgi:hypothetical protein
MRWRFQKSKLARTCNQVAILFIFAAPSLSFRSAQAEFCNQKLHAQNAIATESNETNAVNFKNRHDLIREHFPTGTWKNLTLIEVHQAGIPLDAETFSVLSIPQTALAFFDLQTGKFIYEPKASPLAVEDGKAPLDFIRIGFDSIRLPATDLLKDYLEVLKKMPQLKLVISAHSFSKLKLAFLLRNISEDLRARIKIIYQKNSMPFFWAQDSAKPLADGGLLIPDNLIELSGTSDKKTLVPQQRLSAESGLSVAQSIFDFDGGNMVVGEKAIFIGPALVRSAQAKFKISASAALQAFEKEWGKKVIVVGIPDQGKMRDAVFHLDVLLAIAQDLSTEAKNDVILLSSFKRAIDLIRETPSTDYSEDALYQLVDEIKIKVKRDHRKMPRAELLMLKYFRSLPVHAMVRQIKDEDVLENFFSDQGYRVKKLPGFLNMDNEEEHPQFYTYTNSIFSGNHAIISEFGIPSWDRAAQAELSSLGYQSIGMPSATTIARHAGGVRCASETHRLSVENQQK